MFISIAVPKRLSCLTRRIYCINSLALALGAHREEEYHPPGVEYSAQVFCVETFLG
jgi:hypothetical protein